MGIFELRSREKFLILCSELSSLECHKKLGSGAIADAILDRGVSKYYKFILNNESLLKIDGIDTTCKSNFYGNLGAPLAARLLFKSGLQSCVNRPK